MTSAAKARLKRWRWMALWPVIEKLERVQLATGLSESRRVAGATYDRIGHAEFRVFSQTGIDGILQYLIAKVPLCDESFIEVGVEDYAESNTRFLLQNDNWRGLIIDSGTAHQHFLEFTGLRWRHSIEPVSAFVTAENVNQLVTSAGFHGDIGLLSLDIDGNDYWILEALTVVSPRILVVEYNSVFGAEHAVTVPYDPRFTRRTAHYSNLYFGSSLPALSHLARSRGYQLVGSDRAGVNAVFVRSDVGSGLPDLEPGHAWVASRHRESRDGRGQPTYLDPIQDRLQAIADLPLHSVTDGRTYSVRDLLLS